jgi:dTDP-6-deoxy-L-talose 4-dehydrogenase (NAD+)
MTPRKILVTGANGYIGRHVVANLLENPEYTVIAADVVNTGIDPRAIFVAEDIFGAVDQLFSRLGEPDVCIHLAWREGFNHRSEYHITSIPQHFQFIKTLVASGLRHIAVMGSMHEVGYHEGVIDEQTPCNPSSYYGIAKNTLRQILSIYAAEQQLTFHWLRGYYIYGDDLKNHSVFTKLFEAAARGDREFPFTSGLNRYDFQSIDELAAQITATVSQTDVTGIIECCSGTGVPLKDKVEAYITANNLDITLKYGAFPDRPYDSPGMWGDATKIRRIMGQTD